jgi:hypothetical protein
VAPVVVEREVPELRVPRHLGIGVALAREVAAVDVGAAEAVADAFLAVEVRGEDLLLPPGRQLRPRLRRGVGEGAAEALDGLEGLRGIDDDGRHVLVGLVERLERDGGLLGQAVVGVAGGEPDTDRRGGGSLRRRGGGEEHDRGRGARRRPSANGETGDRHHGLTSGGGVREPPRTARRP